jgi:mannitol/fructose-specific phosphotransferase system IIA component (Ntr-type)
MTMTVGDFTEPSLLIPRLLGTDQASAIHVLSGRLQNAGRVEDSLAFFQAVLQRDYLSSSASGSGVAFPPARGRGINRSSFALGLSEAGVRWRDGWRVHAVFLIAIPHADAQLYLALVSALARLARTDNFMGAVMACAQPDQMWRVLQGVEVNVPANVRSARPPSDGGQEAAATPSGEDSGSDLRMKD